MPDLTPIHVSPRTTVKVTLKGPVDVESLTRIVSTIGGIYGCRTCGLLGFDLNLAGDPGDFTAVKGLPNVGSVEL